MVTDPDSVTAWDSVREQSDWFITTTSSSWSEAIRRSLIVLAWRIEDEFALVVPAFLVKECLELISVVSQFKVVPVISANEVMVHFTSC